jgi:thioredoxin-like negative regulator of GroEL
MNKLTIFTATWCAPCKLYKHIYQPHDPIIHVIDTDEKAMTLARDLGIRGVPTTVIMSEDGTVLRSKTGAMTEKQLEEFIG